MGLDRGVVVLIAAGACGAVGASRMGAAWRDRVGIVAAVAGLVTCPSPTYLGTINISFSAALSQTNNLSDPVNHTPPDHNFSAL